MSRPAIPQKPPQLKMLVQREGKAVLPKTPPTESKPRNTSEKKQTLPDSQVNAAAKKEEDSESCTALTTESSEGNTAEQSQSLPGSQLSIVVKVEEKSESTKAQPTDSSEVKNADQTHTIPATQLNDVVQREERAELHEAQSTEPNLPECDQTALDSQHTTSEEATQAVKPPPPTAQKPSLKKSHSLSHSHSSAEVQRDEEPEAKQPPPTAQKPSLKKSHSLSHSHSSAEVQRDEESEAKQPPPTAQKPSLKKSASLSHSHSSVEVQREESELKQPPPTARKPSLKKSTSLSPSHSSMEIQMEGEPEPLSALSTESSEGNILDHNQTLPDSQLNVNLEGKPETSIAQSTESSEDINVEQTLTLSEGQLGNVVQQEKRGESFKTQATEPSNSNLPEQNETLPKSQCSNSDKPAQAAKQPPPTAPKPYKKTSSVENTAELKEAVTSYIRNRTLSVPVNLPHLPISSTLPHLKAARAAARSKGGTSFRPTPPPKPPRVQVKKGFKSLESLPDTLQETNHNDGNEVQVNGAQAVLPPHSDQQPVSDYERPVSQSDATPTAALTPESQNVPHAPLSKYLSLPAIMMEESPQRSASFKFPQIHSPLKKWSPTIGRKIEHYGLQTKNLPIFKAMTLTELSKKYSKHFPLKIQIIEGHYGTSCKSTISTEDRLNIHFKKRTKEVVIQTYGQDYTIPLSSAIKFGLVFDPTNNEMEAMEGHTFRRVIDLMGVQPLPKLVLVTSGCFCSNGVSIDRDELLVVLKIKKKLFRGKGMLKVFSLQTLSKKMLPEECIGNFSTRPLCLQIYLSQLLEYVPNVFPCKAMMYIDKEDGDCETIYEEGLPVHMFSWPVILKEPVKQKSLVASTENSQQLVDIPLHGSIAEVKAEIVPLHSSDEIEELFSNTQKFLDQFDPTKVDMYRESSSESVNETQSVLYKIVRNSRKCLGVDVVTPLALKKLQKGIPVLTKHTTLTAMGDHVYEKIAYQEESEEEEYEEVEQVVVRPQVTAAATDHYLHNKLLGVTLLPKSGNESAPHSGSGSITYTYLTRQIHTRSGSDDSFSTDSFSSGGSESLQEQQPTASEVPSTPSVPEENKHYLSTLNVSQVQSLLDAMGLGQYKEAFAGEQISGDILVDLEDKEHILKNDLGMTTELHRLRLMKVIRGERSAQNYLQQSLTTNA